MASSAASSSASGNPAMGDSSSPPGGAVASPISSQPPNALQIFNELPVKPNIIDTPDPNGVSLSWIASITFTHDGTERTLTASDPQKKAAKTKVASQYLDIIKPDWSAPPKVKPIAERTADEILHEIGQTKDCTVELPEVDAEGKFCVGKAHYKEFHFEERVPVKKNHNACRKEVSIMLLKKLSVAGHPLAVQRLREFMPYYFVRRRQMPMEENTEVEFKGTGPELGCLTPSHDFFANLEQLRHVLRNVCGFLNTIGGSLWFGVHDSGLIQGMLLTSKERDLLELLIRGEIKMRLQPLSLDHICIRWHEVEIAQDDQSIENLSLYAESLNPVPGPSDPPPKSILKKSAPLPQVSQADRNAAPESVRKLLETLENAWKIRPQATELCLLEVSVLPSRRAHFWDFIALYRNGNQTVTLPIPMLKAKVRDEPV